MDKIIVAIPSEMPGGLDANVGEHFGHCEIYTLVEIEDGQVAGVRTLPNVPHEHGGCMAPVMFLVNNGVKALIAGGMGARPLMGFAEQGVSVFWGGGMEKVGHVVEAFARGGLQRFSPESVCGGCS